MNKLKVVLDTNIVVSGIFWKGPPYQILRSWVAGDFQPILSLEVLDEYQRTLDELSRTKGLSAPVGIIDHLLLNAELIVPGDLVEQICDDPDDDKFIALALAARANYLVSGDKALLRVADIDRLQIVTAKQFLSEWGRI